MRSMADSTNPYDIPKGRFDLVAGYTDGLYAWSANGWAFHSTSRQVRICAVSLDMSAQVADVENGALTPEDGAEFVRRKYARGEIPTLYFSISLRPVVYAAVTGLGLDLNAGLQIWWADWDGRPVLDGDYGVAKQYANPTLSGGHYDLSIVRDYWPGVDPLPPAPVFGGATGAVDSWARVQVLVDADLEVSIAGLDALQSTVNRLG